MRKFKFTTETIGLPDHHILDDEGELSLLVFRQQLGLDGKKSKAAKTKLAKFPANKPSTSLSNERYPLIDWYSYPRWRQLLIPMDLPKYLQEIKKSPKQDVRQLLQSLIHPSWDLIVMDAMAREHFLNSDLIERANEPNLSKNLIEDKEWHPDLQHVLDLVRDSFEEKARGWSDLKDKERRQIAEIGLALASVLDEDIFNRCLDSYEGFDAYFKTMLGFQYNWRQSVVGDLDEEKTGGASPSVEPVSERELYERIIQEAKAGQENPGLIEHIERIQSHALSLLDLIKKHQSKVRLNDAFIAWCNSLFQRGAELALPLFVDDEGVLTQFYGEWHRFFASSEGQNLTARLLKDLYGTAIDSAMSAARQEEAIEKDKSDLALELEAVSAKAVSSPLERRSQAKRKVELGSEIQQKENAILDVQDEATVALLPPGGTIDALLESESLEVSSLDQMAFSETVTDALLEFYSNSLKRGLEHSAESGSVLDTDNAVTARNKEIDDGKVSQIADSVPADHIDDSLVGLAEIEERDRSEVVESESFSADLEGADIEPLEPEELASAESIEVSNESDLPQGDNQAAPNQTRDIEDLTGIGETEDKEGQSKTGPDGDSEEFDPENAVERFQYELEKGALINKHRQRDNFANGAEWAIAHSALLRYTN